MPTQSTPISAWRQCLATLLAELQTRQRIENSLQGQREQFELRFRRRDGTPLDVLASTSPIYAANGSVVGALGLFTDIIARKQVEEALRQRERQS